VPRRPDRRERPRNLPADREIDSVEHAAGRRRRSQPRARAHDGVAVDPPTAGIGELANRGHIRGIVRQRELVRSRVTALAMTQMLEEVEILAQRARNRPQAADVLGVTPAGVVDPAVGVRDVRDVGEAQRTGRRRR
jgi:hypothetical protein